MCYKDKAFCGYKTCAKSYNCDRFLTDEDKKRAEELGLWIQYFMPDDCYEPSIACVNGDCTSCDFDTGCTESEKTRNNCEKFIGG